MAFLKTVNNCIRAFAAEVSIRNVDRRSPATTFCIHPTGVDVMRSEGSRREMLARVPGQPLEAVRTVLARLQTSLDRQVAVELASGLAVVEMIVLPAGSPEVLDAIVRNKVEGLAPWPIAQSVYGQRRSAVPGDRARVAVDIAVVSRVLLEAIDEAMDAHGVAMSSVAVRLAADPALRIDFEAAKHRRAAEHRILWLLSGVAALFALIAGLGVYLLLHASTELRGYRDATAQMMSRIKADPAGGDPASAVAAANMLADQRRFRPSAVAVLNEVSERLPQNVWLVRFAIDGDRIELHGQGTDIPALIDLLEASPYFSGVNFASATQLNAEQNADVFTIEATLESGVKP